MKLLIITNLKHKVSKELIDYLKSIEINFDIIDISEQKKIKVLKKYDYLISFLNTKYISRNIRQKIKKGSYNFHPGPPEYPGFGCYNFALLDRVNFYGSTIHLMNDKFDNGPIINTKKFKISNQKINLEKLILKTHRNIFLQAKKFINSILNNNINVNKHLKWKRKAYTKREFEIAREINLKDTKLSIQKKIAAFSYKNYDSVFVKLKGFKFELKKR